MRRGPLARSERTDYIKIKRYEEQKKVEKKIKQRAVPKISKLEWNIVMCFRFRRAL